MAQGAAAKYSASSQAGLADASKLIGKNTGEAIKASNITTVVTNRKNVERVASLKKACPTLQTIIYTEFHVAPEDQGKQVSVPKGLTAIPLADCFAFAPTKEAAEPTPEQVAVIMYTSGSTGKPKGVLLKHESVLASIVKQLPKRGPRYDTHMDPTGLGKTPK